jgi:hypothetical protein
VPDLRAHLAAGGVNLVEDALPAGERGGAVKERNPRLVARRRPLDDRAFGQDQPDPAFGAPPVVGGDVLPGDAVRREGARHRRHDHAILQLQRLEAKGYKQRVDVRKRHGQRPPYA